MRLDGLNAVALGLQEAWTADDDLLRAMRDEYLLFSGGPAGKSGQEVPVLLSKKARYIGDGAYLVSDRVSPDNKGIAPDRYLTWVRFEWKGVKYAIINMHPNAAVQNRDTGAPLSRKIKRVREFIRSMKELEEEIQSQKADGYVPVVTGDLNYRVRPGVTLWKWSPAAVFKRNGLAFHAEGLDYIAWQATKLGKIRVNVIPASQTGSDHPWLVADLRPKKG